MICPSCRTINPSGMNFCLDCGQSLRQDFSTGEAQPHAAPYALAPASVKPSRRKSNAQRLSWRRLAVISVLAVGVGVGLAQLFFFQWNHSANGPERHVQQLLRAEKSIPRGLLLTSIRPSSPAERSGLLAGDIVLKYDGFAVEDITSYVAAADAHTSSQPAALTVFRNGNEVKLTAPGGYLGFLFEDWNAARKGIYERLQARDVGGAGALYADAERQGSLTENQALIVKIMLIPDRSSREKEEERGVLLDNLISRYPSIHLFQLARTEFSHLRSYAAAARCYEEHLARFGRDNVDARLNLSLCYVRLFQFDAAEENVRYVVNRPNPGLSPHGVYVAHMALGGIALGRHRHKEALDHFIPYLEMGDDYITLMSLLAAAKLADLEKFNEIRDRAAAISPGMIKKIQFDVDTLNAYVLSEKGRSDEAAALVLKWGTPECIVDTASSYWDRMPGGNGITERMRSLVKDLQKKV